MPRRQARIMTNPRHGAATPRHRTVESFVFNRCGWEPTKGCPLRRDRGVLKVAQRRVCPQLGGKLLNFRAGSEPLANPENDVLDYRPSQRPSWQRLSRTPSALSRIRRHRCRPGRPADGQFRDTDPDAHSLRLRLLARVQSSSEVFGQAVVEALEEGVVVALEFRVPQNLDALHANFPGAR